MLRVFEAFSGYGSQSLALERLGIEHEVVAISEIDKYALQAYYALHSKDIPNLGDISKLDVNDIPEHDLFTYSFPCQDISVAGKTKGIVKGETRSGLLYECERIIEAKRPKYLLLENVKNLVGKKFKAQFEEWLAYLESLGYTNYWKVLNAKDYGVPQNRERVFVISILGEHEEYEFPKAIPLDKCIRDILEDEVDKKYYLSDEYTKRFIESTKKSKYPMGDAYTVLGTTVENEEEKGTNSRHWVYDTNDSISTLSATDYKQPKQIAEINQVGMLDIKGNEQVRRVYGDNGISPTLNTMQGGNRQPKIIELPCIAASRGRNPENPSSRVAGEPTEQRLEFNTKGTSNTLTRVQKDNYVVEQTYRIRKLTPRECFRLMGLNDDDIDKIQATGVSNTQQYKMAGNSIVVDVLEAIFKKLFKEEQ